MLVMMPMMTNLIHTAKDELKAMEKSSKYSSIWWQKSTLGEVLPRVLSPLNSHIYLFTQDTFRISKCLICQVLTADVAKMNKT